MGRVRTKMENDLVLRGLSAATQESYLRCAKAFIGYYKRSPDKLSNQHVREWRKSPAQHTLLPWRLGPTLPA